MADKSERSIMHGIMRELSKLRARVFRNTVGVAYQGDAVRFTLPRTIAVQPGDVLVRKARTIRAGLYTGSSDLIGWVTRVIVPADVGHDIAQFLAVEVKSGDGVVTSEQQQFIDVVRAAGGCAIVARSADEAATTINRGANHGNEEQSGRVRLLREGRA